ncbi:hypothetical protein, partial [uncultured Acetatifactor sp.]|uniref:hypothetical protein n=1 Tax=uncultured Acetatifactor sp. TaxID=1671927 RepID=UPI00260AB290
SKKKGNPRRKAIQEERQSWKKGNLGNRQSRKQGNLRRKEILETGKLETGNLGRSAFRLKNRSEPESLRGSPHLPGRRRDIFPPEWKEQLPQAVPRQSPGIPETRIVNQARKIPGKAGESTKTPFGKPRDMGPGNSERIAWRKGVIIYETDGYQKRNRPGVGGKRISDAAVRHRSSAQEDP